MYEGVPKKDLRESLEWAIGEIQEAADKLSEDNSDEDNDLQCARIVARAAFVATISIYIEHDVAILPSMWLNDLSVKLLACEADDFLQQLENHIRDIAQNN